MQKSFNGTLAAMSAIHGEPASEHNGNRLMDRSIDKDGWIRQMDVSNGWIPWVDGYNINRMGGSHGWTDITSIGWVDPMDGRIQHP